ncbi:hypothetical protein M3Y96_00603200 [Aphelenchoides besseyi]|nr:hypothetical protein M3Y96_00603200 [Aphelenchoides besseyi]
MRTSMLFRNERTMITWVAIIILCAQAFVLTMLYLSNYSIIISQGRTSNFQLTNFDKKKVMTNLIKNVKSVDGQTNSLESEQNNDEKEELEQNADSNQVAEEHLDKSKQANPEPDSGSKHEDGRVDEETAQKEAPNLWLRDPEEHYRVPKEKITFSDELNADIYSVDYSLSHPMDNKCRFPILIKDEPDLLPAVEHYVEADCTPSKKPILVEQLHTGEILVGRRFMSKASKNFTCYAQELSGALRPKNIQLNFVGDFIKLPFNKRIYVEKDQFHVQCKDPNGKIVFEDAFTNVPYKERLHPPQLDGTLNFSVALLILDSNSRNQFVRHAPQTLKFMKEQGFQILHGYNKVADNSAVNLLPLLAGKTFDLKKHGIEHLIRPDMHLTPEMIKDDVWKHANMLTKLMKERGCATLWNDDIMVPKLGLLNYDQFKGFYKPVADYHYRPYYEYLYQKQDARKACVNGHLITRRMLGIWERFSTKYARECHFAFTFLTALTHDNANAVELLDQAMYDALLRMKYKGVFDNTIMIIMGDHGQRMSEVQHTYSGRIEERMPLMGVYFPEKFRKAYPEKLRNFIVNKNRFLSNYDMHETFRELLGFNDPKRQPVGKSLFHEIPKDRLCNDTRVVHQHCTCQEPLSESLIPNETKEKMFNELSKYVDYKTKRLECVESARIEPPKTYTPYTINAMVRLGIRTPDMKRIKEGKFYNSTENEIFDVEFDVPLEIQTSGGESSTRRFALKSRMIFHRETKYVRLIAKPLLLDPEKKCINVFVIDDIRIGWRSSEQFAYFANQVSGASEESKRIDDQRRELEYLDENNKKTSDDFEEQKVKKFKRSKYGDQPHGALKEMKLEFHLDESKEVNASIDPHLHIDGTTDNSVDQWQPVNYVAVRQKPTDRVPKTRVTFSDDLDADIYDIDYSFSHPFDNHCRFPVQIKDEPDFASTVEHIVKSECKRPKQEIIMEQLPDGEILINHRFKSSQKTNIKCYYQQLTGTLQPDNKNYQFDGDLVEVPVNRRFFVELDQFYIECRDPMGHTVANDVFTNIPYKERLKPPSLDKTLNFSVSILVLDSTSRNQFYRHAPMTLKFMRENGFLVLNGYNKVNDNSAVNLTPLLAGKSFDVKFYGNGKLLRKDMIIDKKHVTYDFWESANSLVRQMKLRGCATMWNDDIMHPILGLYNYGPIKGFKVPPADYFFRPYYMYLYKKNVTDKICVNGDLGQFRFLRNKLPSTVSVKHKRFCFATKYARTCHFGFSFLTALTHDNANYLELLDERIYNSLLRLQYKGVFDNTIMIIMGDHGQRMSSIQKTYSGRIEERMPFFSIYFPRKFHENYPEKVKQYRINLNRLVSNYDIYETLREILNFQDSDRRPVGVSLFNKIPRNRTCTDARVVHHHCTCLQRVDTELVPDEIKEQVMIDLETYINSTRPVITCVRKIDVTTPTLFQPFTINALARNGIRSASDLKKKSKKVKSTYKAMNHEIFDIEFDVLIRLQTLRKSDSDRKRELVETPLILRTRALYNRKTNYTRLVAKPMLRKAPEKCKGIQILENICSCLGD